MGAATQQRLKAYYCWQLGSGHIIQNTQHHLQLIRPQLQAAHRRKKTPNTYHNTFNCLCSYKITKSDGPAVRATHLGRRNVRQIFPLIYRDTEQQVRTAGCSVVFHLGGVQKQKQTDPSRERVELMPHRNPERCRFGNNSPLLRNELDTCKGSGEGSTQLLQQQHQHTCNEHSCSCLQARMTTSRPLLSRQWKVGLANLKCGKNKGMLQFEIIGICSIPLVVQLESERIRLQSEPRFLHCKPSFVQHRLQKDCSAHVQMPFCLALRCSHVKPRRLLARTSGAQNRTFQTSAVVNPHHCLGQSLLLLCKHQQNACMAEWCTEQLSKLQGRKFYSLSARCFGANAIIRAKRAQHRT